MNRADHLANALEAMGCPHPRSVAVLTLEVLDQLEDDNVGDRRSIFEEAASLVNGERQEDYGDPVECMTKWADTLRVLFGWDIDAHKASLAMVQLKIVRETYTPKRDNRVDGVGYWDIADRTQIRAV